MKDEQKKVEETILAAGQDKSKSIKYIGIDIARNYIKNDVKETEKLMNSQTYVGIVYPRETATEKKLISSILETEYSDEFDNKRKRSMVTSYFKYGPVNENYARVTCPISATDNMDIRLKKWKETKNKDYLIDIANFAMLAFMFETGVYEPKDNENILDGVPINEIKNFDK